MINQFKGEYRFLSNFYPSPFDVHDVVFPTVEHYYQAMKTTSYDEYMTVAQATTPSEAKKLGRIYELREDWEQIKDNIMRYALYRKFENYPLRAQLLETGDEELVEGNTWGDKIWGVDLNTGEGENRLGKMLMDLRENIRKEEEAKKNPNNHPIQPSPT